MTGKMVQLWDEVVPICSNFEAKVQTYVANSKNMVGPEGLPNSSKINRLTPCGTKTPLHKNQRFNKTIVPLFSAAIGHSLAAVARSGRSA